MRFLTSYSVVFSSVVDPNLLCSDPDPGSNVHSDWDPAPDPNRVRINTDPDTTYIVQIFLKSKL